MTRNPFLPEEILPVQQIEDDMTVDDLLGTELSVLGVSRPLGFAEEPVKEWPRSTEAAPYGGVAVVGLHGGAGTSTVTRLLGNNARDYGTWLPASGPTLLVARSNGIGAARVAEAGIAWAAGHFPTLSVVGLVLVADLPKVPKPLVPSIKRALKTFPETWRIGWSEQWHATDLPDMSAESLDRRLIKTRAAIWQSTENRTNPTHQ